MEKSFWHKWVNERSLMPLRISFRTTESPRVYLTQCVFDNWIAVSPFCTPSLNCIRYGEVKPSFLCAVTLCLQGDRIISMITCLPKFRFSGHHSCNRYYLNNFVVSKFFRQIIVLTKWTSSYIASCKPILLDHLFNCDV